MMASKQSRHARLHEVMALEDGQGAESLHSSRSRHGLADARWPIHDLQAKNWRVRTRKRSVLWLGCAWNEPSGRLKFISS